MKHVIGLCSSWMAPLFVLLIILFTVAALPWHAHDVEEESQCDWPDWAALYARRAERESSISKAYVIEQMRRQYLAEQRCHQTQKTDWDVWRTRASSLLQRFSIRTRASHEIDLETQTTAELSLDTGKRRKAASSSPSTQRRPELPPEVAHNRRLESSPPSPQLNRSIVRLSVGQVGQVGQVGFDHAGPPIPLVLQMVGRVFSMKRENIPRNSTTQTASSHPGLNWRALLVGWAILVAITIAKELHAARNSFTDCRSSSARWNSEHARGSDMNLDWLTEVERHGLSHTCLFRSVAGIVGWPSFAQLALVGFIAFAINTWSMVLVFEELLHVMTWLHYKIAVDAKVPDLFCLCVTIILLCCVVPLLGSFLLAQWKASCRIIGKRFAFGLQNAIQWVAHASESPTTDELTQLLKKSRASEGTVEFVTDSIRTACLCFTLPVNIIILVILLWRRIGFLAFIAPLGCLPLVWVTLQLLHEAVAARVKYTSASIQRSRHLHAVLADPTIVKCCSRIVPLMQLVSESRVHELCGLLVVQRIGRRVSILCAAWPRLITLLVLAGACSLRYSIDVSITLTCLQICIYLTSCSSTLLLGLRKLSNVIATVRHMDSLFNVVAQNVKVEAETLEHGMRTTDVRLEGCFSWQLEGAPVLHDLDVVIPMGMQVAIIGAKGAGKTSLLRAFCGDLYACRRKHENRNVVGDAFVAKSIGQASQLLASKSVVPSPENLVANLARRAEHVALPRPNCKSRGSSRIVVMPPDESALSTFDIILLVETGRIVAQGNLSHMKKNAAFKKLALCHLGGAQACASNAHVSFLDRGRHRSLDTARARLSDATSVGDFVMSAGRFRLCSCLSLVLAARGVELLSEVSLARWAYATSFDAETFSAMHSSRVRPLGVCFLMCGLSIAVHCVASLCFAWCSRNFSSVIHHNLFQAALESRAEAVADKDSGVELANSLSEELTQVDLHLFLRLFSLWSALAGIAWPILFLFLANPAGVHTVSLRFGERGFDLHISVWPIILTGCLAPALLFTYMHWSRAVRLAQNYAGAVDSAGVCEPGAHEKPLIASDDSRLLHVRLAICASVASTLFALNMMFNLATGSAATPESLPNAGIVLLLLVLLPQAIDVLIESSIGAGIDFAAFASLSMRVRSQPREASKVLPEDPKLRCVSVELDCAHLAPIRADLDNDGANGCSDSRHLRLLSRDGNVLFRLSESGETLVIADPLIIKQFVPAASTFPECANLHVVAINGVHTKCVKRLTDELQVCMSRMRLTVRRGWLSGGASIQIQRLMIAPDTFVSLPEVIHAGQHVAIARATESGSTTLLHALMRIVEPGIGTAFLGGVDIASIGLAALRDAICFIPRECVLFGRSVRANLDPHGDFKDHELLQVLRQLGLDYLADQGLGKALTDACGRCCQTFGDGPTVARHLALARLVLRQSPLVLIDRPHVPFSKDDQDLSSAVRGALQASTVLEVTPLCNEDFAAFDRVLTIDCNGCVEVDRAASFAT